MILELEKNMFTDEFVIDSRSRLQYEQFSAFLSNIKELNAQKQTREVDLSVSNSLIWTLTFFLLTGKWFLLSLLPGNFKKSRRDIWDR